MNKYKILNDCRGMDECEVFESIMEQRGIENIDEFLNPSEDALLPLDSLKNVSIAYEILRRHIDNHSIIAVLWDTDLDGVSSGAIMTRYLWEMTDRKNIIPFINKGKKHGLIGENINRFADVDLLIIVDSLDKDISQYKALKSTGTEIIILDHHAIDESVPYKDYVTLVSSQDEYDNPQLSGAGVVWKFCKYIDEEELTDYADSLTDLAACGLVADMVDLTVMENRYIVSEGLKQIHNPAIKKIIGSFEFNSTAISFSIAPLINASCRMFENEAAMQLFLADDNKDVLTYKKMLMKCKESQNAEVDRLMPGVLKQCESQKDKKMIVIHIDSKYGIGGLLGNKLVEKYQRPILVLKDCSDRYSGSMRAVGVEDFRAICNESGFAEANGHELASGIDILKKDFDSFIDHIEMALSCIKTSEREILVDIQLSVSDISRGLVDKIKTIDRVSGEGFKPVRVYIDDVANYEVGNMSDYKHLVVKPTSWLWVIKWNYTGTFEVYEDAGIMGDLVSCVGTLDSGFLGRTFVLKLVCDDIWIGGE